jgi:hypothetical protein
MRRALTALAALSVALFALAVGVPAAEAHYVVNQQATCALVGNVPTITASANFNEFGSPDQNIHITVGVDSAVPIDQRLPYAPATNPWSASTPSTGGDHRVYIYITWTHYGTPNDSSFGPTTVTCPPPVVTPPPPPVTPPPPPPTITMCNGQQVPVGTPPVVCPTPPKPKHKAKCKCPHIRWIFPNTRAHQHGTFPFGGHVGGRNKIVAVIITAKAIGRGRPVCGHGTGVAHIRGHGATIPISLYNVDFWRHCLAWGDYRLIIKAKVVVRDRHGKLLGVRWCQHKLRLFNPDPFDPRQAGVASV